MTLSENGSDRWGTGLACVKESGPPEEAQTRFREGSINRHGVSLLELLTVISIITLLISLALPAVQSTRELSRRTSCQNKLRQIGLGIQGFEAAHRQYPPDGWGWGWVGDASLAGTMSKLDGPGGWIHHVLPFVEQQALWESTASREGRNTAIGQPLELFACPSRRDAVASPYTQTTIPLRNANLPTVGSRSDYAINAGDRVISVGPGPADIAGLKTYPVPSKVLYSGISFLRSSISSRDVTDGTSHTLAVAEKLVIPPHYSTGQSLGDDQTMLIGDDADIRRWTQFLPLPDSRWIDDIERFGSAHQAGVNVVLCDGSVHLIAYEVDLNVWQSLGHRSDGQPDAEQMPW